MSSEFSFSVTGCITRAKEPNLLYYLLIAGRRIIGFIRFPQLLVLCEMQSVSSRIWTRVAVSISNGDNHYTTTACCFYAGIFKGKQNWFYGFGLLAYWPSWIILFKSHLKAMDCGIVDREFDLQSHYYVHFRTNTLGKGMNPLILPAMGEIASLLLFFNNFGIK